MLMLKLYFFDVNYFKINIDDSYHYVNYFKINIDDSYHDTSDITVCAWLIKDYRGVYTHSFFCNLGQATFVLAEL